MQSAEPIRQAHPITGTDLCPDCGHEWRWHASRAAVETMARYGDTAVPCIARGLLDICGCAEIAPDPFYPPDVPARALEGDPVTDEEASDAR